MRTSRIVLIGSLVAASVPGQIQWSTSLDEALAKARADKRPVMIALNMDGERANDQMVEDHYRDPTLVKLSRETVNLFCSAFTHSKTGGCTRCKGTRCADHRANDFAVRREILGVDGDAALAAPQHLFVSPEGKVLTSVAYFITEGELEWMMVDAIRKVDPDFEWTVSERARAPAKYRRDGADREAARPTPPTKEEVDAALRAIKKLSPGTGRGAWMEMFAAAQKNARIIIHSDDKRALDWGKGALRSYRQFRNGLIRDIGAVSPKPWAKVVEEWLDHRDEDTRKATVVALEKLGDRGSVRALRRQLKQEKEPALVGRLYRAMATCGPTDRAVARAVGQAIRSDKDPAVRAHAVVAAGLLEDRDAVTENLRLALQDDDAKVRSVAAYVIAIRQDRDLLSYLQLSLQAESDEKVRDWMDKAVRAVERGETEPFRSFLTDVLDGPEALGTEGLLRRAREWADAREKRAGGDENDEKKPGHEKKPGDEKKAGGKQGIRAGAPATGHA